MSVLTLQGRTAVVTGGTRGIGFAIARALAQGGMKAALIGQSPESSHAAQEKSAGWNACCKGYACDLAQVDAIPPLLEQIYADFGSIDVLVNCAGILDTSKIGTLTEEQWDKVLDVNLKGTYFMIQQAVPYLEKSGAPRIINIASNAGRMGGFENGLAYTASKGGMIALTYGAARRLAAKQITVNCVAPGTVLTEMASQGYDEQTRQRLLARFPLGRMGRPEDVAAAVCYFASEEAGFTTGAVLDVNGGLFMG
nr:3-oxoacyl-ACP reductase FabG [uncultured Dysosmobacter sp.]